MDTPMFLYRVGTGYKSRAHSNAEINSCYNLNISKPDICRCFVKTSQKHV